MFICKNAYPRVNMQKQNIFAPWRAYTCTSHNCNVIVKSFKVFGLSIKEKLLATFVRGKFYNIR